MLLLMTTMMAAVVVVVVANKFNGQEWKITIFLRRIIVVVVELVLQLD